MSDLGVNLPEIQEEVSEDTSMANLQVSVGELSPCCPQFFFPPFSTREYHSQMV